MKLQLLPASLAPIFSTTVQANKGFKAGKHRTNSRPRLESQVRMFDANLGKNCLILKFNHSPII